MRNTIRKVTMVVPVLMTSCQVSEKPKNGPVTAQTTTVSKASKKAMVLPVQIVAQREKRSKRAPRVWRLCCTIVNLLPLSQEATGVPEGDYRGGFRERGML